MKAAPALAVCAVMWAADSPVEQHLHQRVAMRDGVRLDTNVFHPMPGSTRWPTILVRTPYGKSDEMSTNQRAFLERGYAIVVQDVRGRHLSEGSFRPLDQEGADGEDTLAWIARQGWSDGKVGMMGGSYLGVVQWQVAVRNPPQLKAIFPAMSGYDEYLDRFYSRGGAFKLGHRLLWMAENMLPPGAPFPNFEEIIRHVPLRTSDRFATGRRQEWYQIALDHPAYDAFWRSVSSREKIENMRVPVFAVGGWFDNYAPSDLEAFAELRRLKRNAHVLIGPWPHNMNDRFTTADFGADAYLPLRGIQLEWFDHWLKGKDTAPPAPARYFVMGVNRWQDAPAWPPPSARLTPLYLASKGHANSADGDGALEWRRRKAVRADEYVYDPRNPTPTRGGPVCCNFKVFPPGPLEQSAIEKRSDVLVYTGEKLKNEIEVTGNVKVLLYVSTSAPDTDFAAKLVDVYPDGSAMSVTDGLLRLRYRKGLDRPELAKPGEVYPVTVDAGVTSIVFRRGHRIRVEISSSNFPRFDRNPNTGRAIADENEFRTARQTVYNGGFRPSALLIPEVTP